MGPPAQVVADGDGRGWAIATLPIQSRLQIRGTDRKSHSERSDRTLRCQSMAAGCEQGARRALLRGYDVQSFCNVL